MAVSARAGIGLLVAWSSACGLAGGGEAQTPVPTDGIGAFGSSSPIELCLGTARVTSPSAGASAGALCVKEGSQGAPCAVDASCDGIERCICGRCVVEACQGASACGSAQVCRQQRCTLACGDDADCSPGDRCVLGGCARPCQSDAACHFGERCDDLQGVCAAKLCGAAVGCGAGDTCEAERVVGELHEPALVESAEGEIGFVELRTFGPSARTSILRARIESPSRWVADPPISVLPAQAGDHLGAPSILPRDGVLELYFAAGKGEAIVRAISSDGGRSFVPDPAPLLVPAEAWEGGFVGSPAAVIFQGKTLLFYEGGARAGIGMAIVDGGVATRLRGAPIVSPASVEDPEAWWGVTEVGAPFALVVGDALRLYFTARGAEGGDAVVGDASLPPERNDSIGLFASRDGQTFVRSPTGPVFARIANLRAHLGEREASVRVLPGGAEITFVSADAAGSAVSGLARAGH